MFSELKTNLIINAVDILHGTEYLFTKKGFHSVDNSEMIPDKQIDITEAILASCAIPGVFLKRKYSLMGKTLRK